MFFSTKKLLRACLAPKPRRPLRRKAVVVRNSIEFLENRIMLDASQDVAGLRFFTTGTFTQNGAEYDTTSPVQVGFVPDGSGAAFKPLLQVAGGANITTTS